MSTLAQDRVRGMLKEGMTPPEIAEILRRDGLDVSRVLQAFLLQEIPAYIDDANADPKVLGVATRPIEPAFEPAPESLEFQTITWK